MLTVIPNLVQLFKNVSLSLNFTINFYWSAVALQCCVSAAQQNESAPRTRTSPPFWTSFPCRSPKRTKENFSCCTILLQVWLRQSRICLQCKRPGFDPWGGKIPWRREWQPTPVFLPGEFHGQRSLVGYSPQGHKELDTTE